MQINAAQVYLQLRRSAAPEWSPPCFLVNSLNDPSLSPAWPLHIDKGTGHRSLKNPELRADHSAKSCGDPLRKPESYWPKKEPRSLVPACRRRGVGNRLDSKSEPLPRRIKVHEILEPIHRNRRSREPNHRARFVLRTGFPMPRSSATPVRSRSYLAPERYVPTPACGGCRGGRMALPGH
jgi:hypothetical protein